jgi:hypothetical protein
MPSLKAKKLGKRMQVKYFQNLAVDSPTVSLPFLRQRPCLTMHNTTRSVCIAGFGLLTGCRLRHITSPSWRPSNADTGHGATLPKNPATIAGRTCRIHWSFWGVSMRGPTDGNTFFKELLASILAVTLWGLLMFFLAWFAR